MSNAGGESGATRSGADDGATERGASEIIGLVLLFALVIAGAAIILAANFAFQEDVRNQNRMDAAESSMVELDNRLSSLSYRTDANLTDVDFPEAKNGRYTVETDSTAVRFKLNRKAACSATVELGSIKFTQEDESVAYEGGGVWKISDGRATMVSSPALHYRNGTVSFAADTIRGSISDPDRVYASKYFARSKQRSEQVEKNLLTPRGQCTLRTNLTIEVRSVYHEAWLGYLQNEFPDGASITDHDANQTVRVFLGEDDLDDFDSDGDGTPDGEDNCPKTFNPSQRDTDNDGDGDACDPDDDGDGYPDRGYYDGRSPTDDDDLKDAEDNCQKLTNPNQRDQDGDGLGYRCEKDPDGDGVHETEDNCRKGPPDGRPPRRGYNPNQNNTDRSREESSDTKALKGDVCDPDDDGDGVRDPRDQGADPDTWDDAADNCPKTYNPPSDPGNPGTQPDTDGGGRGDACDDDDDGDDVPDDTDNCPGVPNGGQKDGDGDGTGDACDGDADDDGVDNGNDNCPLTANAGQTNTDKNKYDGDDNPRGDACDTDDDGDTVKDPGDAGPGETADGCPKTWNKNQNDTDNNGQDDACDSDDDGDGVQDDDDNCQWTINPGQRDSDGDGVGDECEPDVGLPRASEDYVDITGIDAGDYRRVTVYATVNTSRGRSGDLGVDDFQVYEDREQREVTNVEGPEEAAVDVVFVVDTTETMGGELSALKSETRRFARELTDAGIDARFGLVTFRDDNTVRRTLTRDIDAFQRSVDALSASGGGGDRDDSVDAIHRATRMDLRADAQTVVIHVTDASSHNDNPLGRVVGALNSDGVAFYTLSPELARGRSKVRRIADRVGGEWTDVASTGPGAFLDDVAGDLTGRYAVTFETCRAADGSTRTVHLYANGTRSSTGRNASSYTAPNGPEQSICPDPPDRGIPDDPPIEPDPDRERIEGGNPDDDDPGLWERPICHPDETPDWRPDLPEDPADIQDPDGDGIPGCYPSEIPDHSPRPAPAPYTNVISINVDIIEFSDEK